MPMCTHFLSTGQAQFHLLAVWPESIFQLRIHYPVCLPLLVGLTAKLFSKIYDEIVSKLFDFVSSHVATVLAARFWFGFVWFGLAWSLVSPFKKKKKKHKKRIRKYVHVTSRELRVLAICHPRPEQFKAPWSTRSTHGHTWWHNVVAANLITRCQTRNLAHIFTFAPLAPRFRWPIIICYLHPFECILIRLSARRVPKTMLWKIVQQLYYEISASQAAVKAQNK